MRTLNVKGGMGPSIFEIIPFMFGRAKFFFKQLPPMRDRRFMMVVRGQPYALRIPINTGDWKNNKRRMNGNGEGKIKYKIV
jgi:hypothetical protein